MKFLERMKENKIFFVTFFLLVLTSVNYLAKADITNLMDNYYYPLYVVNYSCGYSSRLLIGSIFSLFFDGKLSVLLLTKILLIIYFAMCFFISLFINNHLKKTNFEAVGIYAVFMILSPVFLSMLKYFGVTDMFWIFAALGSMWAVNKKGVRWLVPLFCVFALAVHEVFTATYLLAVAIAVLYQFVKKPNAHNFIFIAVCAIIVGSAAVYFLFIGDNTMKMTADEMVAYAKSRLDLKGNAFDEFYLRSVFYWETPGVEAYEGFSGYLQYNMDQYTTKNLAIVKEIVFFIFLNLLTFAPFVYLVVKSFKKESNMAKKFIFACSLIPVPLSVALLFFSTDTERFSMHLLLTVLLLIIFFVKEKDSTFTDVYNETFATIDKNKTVLAFIGLFVAKLVLSEVRF